MKNDLKILLASPRGFCAGVDRAIEIVNKALKKFGSPVYVRHEIVHNKQVVEELKKRGAIFVEELSEHLPTISVLKKLYFECIHTNDEEQFFLLFCLDGLIEF